MKEIPSAYDLKQVEDLIYGWIQNQKADITHNILNETI